MRALTSSRPSWLLHFIRSERVSTKSNASHVRRAGAAALGGALSGRGSVALALFLSLPACVEPLQTIEVVAPRKDPKGRATLRVDSLSEPLTAEHETPTSYTFRITANSLRDSENTRSLNLAFREANDHDCTIAEFKNDEQKTYSLLDPIRGKATLMIPKGDLEEKDKPLCAIQVKTDPANLTGPNRARPILGLPGECAIGERCSIEFDKVLVLTPIAPAGYQFKGWDTQSTCHGNTICQVTCNFPATLTATFKKLPCGEPGTWCNNLPLPGMRAIWGTNGKDFWVGGIGGLMMHQSPDSPLKFEGIASGFTLRSIWGRDNNDIFAVGEQGKVYHFNGKVWSTSGTIPPDPALPDVNLLHETPLNAVAGNSAGDVWLVGSNGLVLRRRDGKWEPNTPMLDRNITINAVSVGEPGAPVFLAGQRAVGGMSGGPKQYAPYLSEMSAGSMVEITPKLESQVSGWRALWGISTTADIALWVGGTTSEGDNVIRISRKQQESWDSRVAISAHGRCGAASTPLSVNSLWGRLKGTASEIWAAADRGSICRFDEQGNMSYERSPPPKDVQDGNVWGIWGPRDGDSVFAVGDDGLFHRVVSNPLTGTSTAMFIPLPIQ